MYPTCPKCSNEACKVKFTREADPNRLIWVEKLKVHCKRCGYKTITDTFETRVAKMARQSEIRIVQAQGNA